MGNTGLTAQEEADLERFEEKQVRDYFQYAYDADNYQEADEAVKELLKIKIQLQLDRDRPRRRVVSSVSGSVHRDLLVEGKIPLVDTQAEIRKVVEQKLKIVTRAIAGLQAVYKDRNWTWPKLSSKELERIR